MAEGSGKSTTGRSDAEVRDALSLVAKAEKAGIKTVQLQFVDIHGTVKSVQIPIHQMAGSIKHGSWFDGSSVEGFTRIAESDQLLRADMSTWRVLPWAPAESGVVLMSIITSGSSLLDSEPTFIPMTLFLYCGSPHVCYASIPLHSN